MCINRLKIMFSHLLHFLRLHQIVYQLSLVIVIFLFEQTISSIRLFFALILIIFITPSFLLLQDLLGKKDDELFNQKRLIFSDRFNKLFFITSILLMVTILFVNSISSLICYVCLFVSTIGYAAAKHYRLMFIAYSFRFLSSLFTFLIYIYLLIGSLPASFYIFLFFVSIFDLIGNIAGDIRDMKKDKQAGVKTFVTIFGMDTTIQIMSILMIIAFSSLLLYSSSALFLILFLANLPCFIILELIPIKFAHGVFHLSKLINFIIIAAVINQVAILSVSLILIFIIVTWFIAYYFYLSNSGYITNV